MKDVKIKISVDSKDATKKVSKLGKEVKKTSKETGKAGGALSKGFAGLGDAIGGAIPMLGRLRTAIASTGIGLFVIAIGAMATAFASIITKSSKFEKALSNLQAVTGASAGDISRLSKEAKELGSTTAFTAAEVVSLQTELAKLGFKTDDISNSTASILDLAASLGVGLGEAAEFSGSLVKSFGLTTKDTAKIVDVMAKSTSSSALNFEALRESLKLVAPASKATGVSIEETTALLGVLADRGLKGSIAGTGLAKTFVKLRQKGISLEEGMRRVNESAEPLITAIDLVGEVAGKTFLTLASGSEDIDGLEQSFINAEGAAQEMAEVKLDNLAGDTTKLASAWEGLLLSIEDGTGMISRIARGFVQLATSVTSFLTPQKDAIQGIKDQQTELFKLESQLLNTNTSEEARRDIIIQLKKEYPDYLGHLDTEKTTNKELSDAISKVNDNLVNKIILARKDQEIQEQAENVADKTISKIEARRDLEQVLADNRAKHNLDAVEGTLEEQAAAQRQQILDKGTLISLQDRDTATKNLRNGVSLLQTAQAGLNEEQGKQTEMLSEQDALYAELGIKRVKTEEEVVEEILDTEETLTEGQKTELEKRKQDREDFLKKLKKLEEDTADKDALDKIERKRERHLAEMENLITDETEKEEAKKAINDIYDKLAKEQRDKNFQEEAENNNRAIIQKQRADSERFQRELEDKQAFEDSKRAMEDISIDHAKQGIGILTALAGESKALKAASLIAEHAANIAGIAIGASRSIADRKAAHNAIPLMIGTTYNVAKGIDGLSMVKDIASTKLSAGLGIASTGVALAQGLSALGGGGSASGAAPIGGGSDSGGASAPSFNLVEGTESNAIQDSITNQGNAPIKAFVTSGDITKAQQLDRQAEVNSGF